MRIYGGRNGKPTISCCFFLPVKEAGKDFDSLSYSSPITLTEKRRPGKIYLAIVKGLLSCHLTPAGEKEKDSAYKNRLEREMEPYANKNNVEDSSFCHSESANNCKTRRSVVPQVIDQDTEQFRNRLEHLLNGFKIDAVSEFMSMKKALLECQKEAIRTDTHKYLAMY